MRIPLFLETASICKSTASNGWAIARLQVCLLSHCMGFVSEPFFCIYCTGGCPGFSRRKTSELNVSQSAVKSFGIEPLLRFMHISASMVGFRLTTVSLRNAPPLAGMRAPNHNWPSHRVFLRFGKVYLCLLLKGVEASTGDSAHQPVHHKICVDSSVAFESEVKTNNCSLKKLVCGSNPIAHGA